MVVVRCIDLEDCLLVMYEDWFGCIKCEFWDYLRFEFGIVFVGFGVVIEIDFVVLFVVVVVEYYR